MKEIGSEFYLKYEFSEIKNINNEAHLLSGRTALRFIIDDIRKEKTVKKALLPSYCCESMIIPFLHEGIDVEFYNVDNKTLDYPYGNDADIILLIDFFGYTIGDNITIAQNEKKVGKILIYDSTHKIDGNEDVERYADYSFCSYRKWFYCNYAKAVKHNGAFCGNCKLTENEIYVRLRDEAVDMKENYLKGKPIDKRLFLSKFGQAEEILDKDYTGYGGKPVDFDLNDITEKRRKNASYLIKKLKKVHQVKLWRDEIGDKDVPMFVPVLVNPSIRNCLRNYLISEKIYCPVHWSETPHHKSCNDLYDEELSLICDQRYNIDDMERIVDAVKKYFSK